MSEIARGLVNSPEFWQKVLTVQISDYCTTSKKRRLDKERAEQWLRVDNSRFVAICNFLAVNPRRVIQLAEQRRKVSRIRWKKKVKTQVMRQILNGDKELTSEQIIYSKILLG